MLVYPTRDRYIRPSLFFSLLILLLSYPAVLPAQTGKWEEITTSGATPEKRHESAFVRVDDKFYLLGGRGNKKIQVFDPATKSWSNTNTSLNDIHHFQARAYRGKIYLLGALTGGYPNENPLTNVLIYDPQQDKLTTGATIPANRRRGSSGVVVYSDVFYVVAGNRNGHSAFLDNGTTPANVSWTDKYDPVADVWTVLPDAPHARDHFFAEVIGNKLYVAGGRRSKYGTPAGTFSDTETAVDVFDLTAEKWLTGSALPANLPTARAGAPTAVVNNELLVIGGEVESNAPNNLAIAVTEVLNPSTGTWRRADDLVLQRHATQAILYEGAVYLAAGSKTKGGTEITPAEVFTEAFSYNGLGGTEYKNWTNINQSPQAKSEAQLVTYGGEYYIFTGFKPNIKIAPSVDKYNPATNTWTALAPMPTVNGTTTAVTHQGVAVVDDKIWHVGGRVGDNPGPVTDAVWIYDISKNSWSPGPKLPLRRGGGGLGRLGRKLHYVGGFDENASCNVDIHLVYDLDNPAAGWQDWTSRSPMPLARVHFGTVVYGGKLYTVGGQNGHDGCGGGANGKLLHVYDPITDQWSRLADLPGVDSHLEPNTFVHNNKIVVVGGQSFGKTVWEYDPATNKWTVLNQMELPLALLAPGTRVYNGNLYVLNGGAPGTSSPVNTTRVKQFTSLQNPALAFNPGSINLSLDAKQQKKTEIILANLNGEEGTPYAISTDNFPGWLSIDKASGYARESFTEIELTVNPSGLSNGTYSYTLEAKATGYQPAKLTVTLTVTGGGTPPTDPGADPVSVFLEAECAAVGSQWLTETSGGASAGSYVVVKPGNNSYNTPPADNGSNRVTFTAQIPAGDSYQLFARIQAASGSDDSFWVRVNGGNWIKWWQGLETGAAFAWREVLGSPFALPAGQVTIDVAYREDGALLDKLLITTTDQAPGGQGGEAKNCVPPTPKPEPTVAIRINAGGPATSYQGNQFSADGNFSGGKTYANTSATVPALYQTERSSNAPYQYSYRVPVPNGEYDVRLHFAEIYFGATGGGPGGTGKRIFDVTLENKLVLNNFDINAEVGPQTVVTKTYTVTVTDGAVDLFFDASTAVGGTNQPKLSALEVLGRSGGGGTDPESVTALWAEAECATGGSAWQTISSSTASSGSAVVFPGNDNRPAPTQNTPSELLTYTVDLTEGGAYKLYFRMNTPSPGASGKNSFWVSVDNGSWIKFWRTTDGAELLTDGFAWREVNDDTKPLGLSLSPGRHNIRVAPRESGTQLDKVYLGKQTSAPTGLGDKATNCGGVSSAQSMAFSAQVTAPGDLPASLSLYPNPVTDRLTFALTAPLTGGYEAQVLDLYGRVVLRQAYAAEAGTVGYLEVATLPAATYYLRVVGEGVPPLLQSFVKQ